MLMGVSYDARALTIPSFGTLKLAALQPYHGTPRSGTQQREGSAEILAFLNHLQPNVIGVSDTDRHVAPWLTLTQV
jgi:hypothetical protein